MVWLAIFRKSEENGDEAFFRLLGPLLSIPLIESTI